MRTKVTLVLIFLNVALFFFIFKFERSWRTEAALQEARRRVLGSETADIRSLTVSSTAAGAQSYALVRNRDLWMLTKPLDWPANQHAVLSIIHELQFLENETSFNVSDLAKNGQSLADYGLEKPQVTVTFTSTDGSAAVNSSQVGAGPTTVLRIGDSTKIGNRVYVLSPDGTRVNVVGRSLLDALSIPLDELRAATLLTVPVFEARALSIQTSGTRVRVRRDGDRWWFDTIVNARASKTALDVTIGALNGLHVMGFPSAAPTTLPSNSPTLRVTIEGNNRSETLFLGDPVKPSAPAPSAAAPVTGETEFVAQLMNGNSVRAPVFTVAVPNALLERMRHAQDDLRERRIVEFDPSAVTSITLAAPGQPSLTLQRLDANTPDSPWQVVRRTDAATGPQTLAADTAAVHRLLEKLGLLAATSFESDAPSNAQLETWGFNRPEREITLALTGAPGTSNHSVLLQLGLDSKGAVFARVGTTQSDVGPSIYAVAADLAQDFPVDTRAWRDRTLRQLAATARISGVKITDLSTHQVVFENGFDAAGHPTSAPRDPAAVQALLAGMRTLQAKRFVLDGFPERVTVAGDDRPWRYQLDTVIALPGGAGAEQTNTSTLFLTDRVGGAQQLAGSKEFDSVFELEQPLIDALWTLTYGGRDPGPQPEKK